MPGLTPEDQKPASDSIKDLIKELAGLGKESEDAAKKLAEATRIASMNVLVSSPTYAAGIAEFKKQIDDLVSSAGGYKNAFAIVRERASIELQNVLPLVEKIDWYSEKNESNSYSHM